MKNQKNNIDLLDIEDISTKIDLQTEAYLCNKDLLLSKFNADTFRELFTERKPYIIQHWGLAYITRGEINVRQNTDEFKVKEGDIILTPPQSITELISCSDDMENYTIDFSEQKFHAPFIRSTMFSLTTDERSLIDRYIDLMFHAAKKFRDEETLCHVLNALLKELQGIQKQQALQHNQSKIRYSQLLYQFFVLLRKYSVTEHKIAFYADRLYVTPNYLNQFVKEATGRTIQQWLDHGTIIQAKAMLCYTDYTIWEISERMNFSSTSFFSKFFKKATGLTPKTYRTQQWSKYHPALLADTEKSSTTRDNIYHPKK